LEHEATLRPMRPDEVDEVFAVVQAAFGSTWPRLPLNVPPLDHLKWKIDSPQPLPDHVTVVEVDGRVVGYNGAVGRDVWLRGRRLPGRVGADRAVHPDYQDRGLNRRWDDWFENERASGRVEPVGVNEGSRHPRLVRSAERQDGRVLIANQADRLTLHLNPPGVRRAGAVSLRSVLGVARIRVRMLVNSIRWRKYWDPPPAVTMLTLREFDARADSLWEQTRELFDFSVVRDRRYLNWRYCDPRGGIYRVRGAEQDGQFVGFVVTAVRGGDAQLVDLLAIPGDEGVLRALIEDAISTVRDECVSLTALVPRVHPYRETFLRYGFIPSKPVPSLGYWRRADNLLDFLLDDTTARIHVAFGDTDYS